MTARGLNFSQKQRCEDTSQTIHPSHWVCRASRYTRRSGAATGLQGDQRVSGRWLSSHSSCCFSLNFEPRGQITELCFPSTDMSSSKFIFIARSSFSSPVTAALSINSDFPSAEAGRGRLCWPLFFQTGIFFFLTSEGRIVHEIRSAYCGKIHSTEKIHLHIACK